MPDRFLKSSVCSGFPESIQTRLMRTLVVVGGVGGNPSVKKNDLKIMSALKNGKICVDLIASGKKNHSI